jgi:hypothetical protein
LPEAHGGRIEIVREIVGETISNAVAAGLSIGPANRELAAGDAAYAAQDYRTAFRRYITAYRNAGP